MKGSMIASMIESEMRRKKYYRDKLTRQKCCVNEEKQCDKCKFFSICENREIKDEGDNSIESNQQNS